MNAKALRKATAADAEAARAEAKLMGYKIRVARTGMSLRLIGKTDEVRDVAVMRGLVSPCGEPASKPFIVPDYNGETQFFAYVPAH